MDLRAWRDDAPIGAFLQPIRLAVAGVSSSSKGKGGDGGHEPQATASNGGSSSASAPLDAPTDNAVATTPADAEGGATAAEPPGGKKPARRRQTAALPAATPRADSLELEESELLLEPFEGARVQRCGDRMVLHAGGPVWALDWLPAGGARRRRRSPAAKSPKSASGGARTQDADGGGSANSDSDSDSDDAGDSPGARAAREQLARDWRFLALSTHPPCGVVDGKLAKPTPPDHYFSVGEDAAARGLVQIWAVPVRAKAGAAAEADAAAADDDDEREPKLVFAIDHESGVAWDLQWSPLVHAMPARVRSQHLLGVLAVCFGDGSVQVFEVPAIAPESLSPEGRSKPGYVERLQPTVRASVPSVLQLSVQWSPHRWNLILTGGSDGSVCLWNLEQELSQPEGDGGADASADATPPLPMEPQRRFQDVDTVGKQEAFEWGWGWVAVRAVAWSPFDEFVFATTGNDSVFKVWDVREPRICARSHRIRSTWGLSLQWMDPTSIQISGDQGMIFMYDIMSGSYQKLYYHPQTDSPVWNIELARRESNVPLLASCCASGSVRVAPAKRLFRATQHSVELFRLAGEHDADVNKPYKELRASFERKIVAEPPSPAIREFCERDAALHRLRVSTSTTGAFPCFLAAGGHAGLVVVMELQEALDSILRDYYLPANRKQGRPRKAGDLWGGATKAKGKAMKKPPVLAAGVKKARATGPKPAKAKKTHTALVPGDKKKRKPRALVREAADWREEPSPRLDISEEEYVDGNDEDESTSSLSLLMTEDNSEDDRATISSDEMDDEAATQPNVERARMMSEYQMDLHEEDAIMLAIQISEMEQTAPSSTVAKGSKGKAKASAVTSSSDTAVAGSVAVSSAKGPPSASQSGRKKKSEAVTSVKPAAQAAAPNKRLVATDAGAMATPPSAAAASKTTKKKSAATASGASSAAAAAAAKALSTAAKKPSQPKKTASKAAAKYRGGYIMDQVATLQMIQFQNGVAEEDALLEVLRISEAEARRRSEVESAVDASAPSAASAASAGDSIPAASSGAKAAKPRPVSTSASAFTAKKQQKKTLVAAVKAPEAHPPAPSAVSADQSLCDGTEEAMASEPTNSLPGDTAAVIDAPKEPEQPVLAAAKASAAVKRKRPTAKPAVPRKRPAKSATSSSSGGAGNGGAGGKSIKPTPAAAGSKASDAQVASGYLTDEEALYLALRASEVEY